MEEDTSSETRIGRTSSIENELRTLDVNQIQYAREAALHVVTTRSVEDASMIFTAGLEPIDGSAVLRANSMRGDEDGDDGYFESRGRWSGREVATAPF